MELARDYEFTIGGMVHDGFELPEAESVLPPYLRAQYSDPAITMDGRPAEVSVEHTIHAVDISAQDEFAEGEHEGTVDYRVTGAAVGAEHGPTVAEEDNVWLIGSDELENGEVVRITLDVDEVELIEPEIDSTK